MADQRIVYGARCVWWDSIDKVSRIPDGSLPCCPHCQSVLLEMPNEEEWWKGADQYEAAGHPGYVAMMKWSRGRCFKSMAEMETAYKAQLS